jgi:hypothetical protein
MLKITYVCDACGEVLEHYEPEMVNWDTDDDCAVRVAITPCQRCLARARGDDEDAGEEGEEEEEGYSGHED